MKVNRKSRGWVLAGVVGAALALGGCNASLSPRIVAAANAGEYGPARVELQDGLSDNPSDRSYILDRLRLMILTLADGQPAAAEEVANQAFSLLRTQGINEDRTVAAVAINEGVKIWKGEPFEQALAYSYIAVQKAELGQWDNARAAANASLFLLKNFGENERGEPLTNIDVARKAAEADQAEGKGAGDRYLDHGYQPIKTDFALGYLLTGVASQALGRPEEASDNFNQAVEVRSQLAPLAEQLKSGGYNTVLVVDYGIGPTKFATGPDNAFARFRTNWPTDDRALSVSVEGGTAPLSQAPVVQDVNQMALSLMWNNLEDVRTAKSVVGSALLVGGAAVAVGSNNRDAQMAGLAVALIGAAMKATAHADTRHAELLPQRVYVVPVQITGRDARVTLEVEGDPASRLVLTALDAPEAGKTQLRYVRISPAAARSWACSGEVRYGNDDFAARVDGDTLPFILGGRDVSMPSAAAMQRYRQAGWLTGMTLTDLENLYREEGIALTVEDAGGKSRTHVLEGGDSLVAPLAGTAGYSRLFGQDHPPYEARSKGLRAFLETMQAAGAPPESTPPATTN